MILLDSCVVSEAIKPEPDARVLLWLDTVDEDALCISSIALGELYRGIELLPESGKRDALRIWFEELRERFSDRVLDLDADTMLVWGGLSARLKKEGAPAPIMATLTAACALRNNMLLATRNVKDFARTGAQLTNPWEYRLPNE